MPPRPRGCAGQDELYPPVSAAGARAAVDSALAFDQATLYPSVAKLTYPVLGYPAAAGSVPTAVAALGAAAVPAAVALAAHVAEAAAAAVDEQVAIVLADLVGASGFIGAPPPPPSRLAS